MFAANATPSSSDDCYPAIQCTHSVLLFNEFEENSVSQSARRGERSGRVKQEI
ncbi:MAG: hypothetical protein ACI8Y4_004712 [Candidatus Poriferisodalaceae bacterium]|jgi:hypothetical protein